MIRAIPVAWTLPRETKEWVGPITTKANGVAVTNFKVALMIETARPVVSDWLDPVPDGTDLGVIAGPNLPIGRYKVWVKYSTALEDVVLDDVGIVDIT